MTKTELRFRFKQNKDFRQLTFLIVSRIETIRSDTVSTYSCHNDLHLSLEKTYVDLHVDYVFYRSDVFVRELEFIE